MPPAQNKTNFRTYEASTRLLAAVLATINGKVKLDFKDLAALMGGGTTGSAVDHRLRPVKQLAKMQAAYVAANKDPGELPVETGEIQKLFGESTAGGIEWQFREIKALGRAQQEALERNENPADVTVGGPSRVKASASATSTPGTAKATRVSASAGSKRKRGVKKATMSEEGSDDQGADSNYDAKDINSDDDYQTTPAPKRRTGRGAGTKGKAAPAPTKNGTAKGTNGTARKLFSNGNGDDGQTSTASIFGDGTLSSASKDDVIELAASSDEAPAHKKSTRSRVKVEPELEQEEEEMGYEVNDVDGGDDLLDGEI
ncbi:hypothetical protein F5Y06DRAFT_294931 [Hypoxylon sp. FL0890]|nr:hypothetical protein F5Y06DRAFT_294931 [Hypoxylon sp. FL0890]